MDSRNIVSAKIKLFRQETLRNVKETLTDASARDDKVTIPAMRIITDIRECHSEKGKKSADWFQAKINMIASQYQTLSSLREETQTKISHIQTIVSNMLTSLQAIKRELDQVRSQPTKPGSLERDILDLLGKAYKQLSESCDVFAPMPQVFQSTENARLELLSRCDTGVPKLFQELKALHPTLIIPSLTAAIKNMPVPSAPPQELVEQKEQQFSKPASSSQSSYMQYNTRAEGQPEGQSAGSTSQYEQKEQQSVAAPVRYAGAGVQTTAGIMGRLPAQAPQQGAGVFAHQPAPSTAPVQAQVQSTAALPIQRISLSAQFREYQALKKNTSISMPQQIRRVVA